MVHSTARLMSSGQLCQRHRRRTDIFTIAVLFLRAMPGFALVCRAPIVVRLAAVLAPVALAAVLLVIPADEARAHDDTSATLHAETYPLHDAVRLGDLDSANHFITVHMANVNAKASGNIRYLGHTPLHFAANYGYASIVSVLIAARADVNAKSLSSWCAPGTGAAPCGGTPLHQASASIASMLIAAGANVNAKTRRRKTPLHFAAGYQHVSNVSVLIAAGADVNAKDSRGWTPLIESLFLASLTDRSFLHRISIVAALIAAEADVNAKDDYGHTPLHQVVTKPPHWANVTKNKAFLASVLIAAGADVNTKNLRGDTPLHDVANNGYVSMISVLIAAGADVDATGEFGATPLYLAADRGHVTVVLALIAAGADVNAKYGSKTPLRSTWFSGYGYSRFRFDRSAAIASALIAAGGHWGEACVDGNVVNPAMPSPPCICEFPKVKTNLGACEIVAICNSPSVLNARTNRCDCPAPNVGMSRANAPGDCVAASVESCGGLTPAKYYSVTLAACVPVATCASPAVLNAGENLCDCPAPNIGADGADAPGDCAVLSAESCGGLTPPQFYSVSMGACVPFVECAPPLVLHADANDCHHAEFAKTLHEAVEAGDLDSVNHFITVHMADVNAKSGNYDSTPLHLAVAVTTDARVSIVLALIAAGADVNATGGFSDSTPLYLAAHYGRVSVVSALIAAGADVDAKSKFDQSPLHWATSQGRVSVISLLIAAGVDVNVKDRNDYTPLHWAAGYSAPKDNRVSIVSLLIAAGADVDAAGGSRSRSSDWTPLHMVAGSTNAGEVASIVSLLIAAGADVNAKTSIGLSPMHRARYASIVSLLAAAGADVNAKTNSGPPTLISQRGATPLHYAAGSASLVSALIAVGANVNAKDDRDRTPLHWVGSYNARRVLIAAGGHWGAACANAAVVNPAGPSPPCVCESPNIGTPDNCIVPSAENCGGLTPAKFYDADAGRCAAFVECLTEATLNRYTNRCECPPGAFAHGDPAVAACHADHAPIPHNLSGWESAVYANNPTLVAHFISGHGRDPDENYALHLAAYGGYYLAAKTLIESGADINLKRYYGSGYGDPPLHFAVRNRRAKLITLLLRRGADADAQSDDDGDTALHLAAQRPDAAENAGLIAFLLDAGADPNIRNDDGWRPLDLAYHGGTPSDLTWQARRGMMAALIAGGATWSDECTSGAIPNENYRPSSGIADCVCPLHISERDSRGRCECPAHSHAQVNGRCLPKDSAQVEAEIVKMEAELLRLRASLVSLNARLSAAAEMPREAVEEIAERAADAAQEIKRRRDNFLALARADLAGAPPPPVAMSDTAAECRMLGGEVQIHSATGIRVCSGIDANDTFCLVDSADAYPCRGLFRHIRRCNDDYNRPALNPFFCGPKCGERSAVGNDCE